MTREEQIFEASKTYSEYEYNQTIYENGFINGADERMIKNYKSQWIFLSDVTHWMPIPKLPKE